MFSALRKLFSSDRSAVAAPPAEPVLAPQATDELLVNAYATTSPLPPIDFPHTLHARRDESDPELDGHLRGFAGFVMRDGAAMTPRRFHVLAHLRRVRQHASLGVAPAHLEALHAWAARANAILFLPDGSLVDPSGRLLVDGAGQEGDGDTPHPDDAWHRKRSTEAVLAARGLHAAPHLPPREAEGELRLRGAGPVLARACALLVVAARAASFSEDEPLPTALLRERLPLAFRHLSPREAEFLQDDAPTRETTTQLSWRYEGATVLAWAIGLLDTLPFPDAPCDVDALTTALLGAAEHPGTPALRPAPALLDALDLHYRLLWIVHQAHIDAQEPPPGLHAGVVQERLLAFNWLARFQDADWDDVDTPT